MSFSDPQNNIEQLGLSEGMRVADLGVGSGFYSLQASKIVGDSGRVFAIDVQKDLLSRLKRNAEAERLSNIEIIWGDVEKIGGTKLAEKSVDVVLVTNILFQIENKKDLITEIKRILKPNGRILVIDWLGSFGGLGPKNDSVVDEKQTENIFTQSGFATVNKINAGDHHYGIIFRLNK